MTKDSRQCTQLIFLPSRIDLHNAETWYLHLDQLLSDKGHDLRLDLSGTTIVDTAGCAILVRLVASARRHGRSVRLINASRSARTIIELFRLHGLLRDDNPPETCVKLVQIEGYNQSLGTRYGASRAQ